MSIYSFALTSIIIYLPSLVNSILVCKPALANFNIIQLRINVKKSPVLLVELYYQSKSFLVRNSLFNKPPDEYDFFNAANSGANIFFFLNGIRPPIYPPI